MHIVRYDVGRTICARSEAIECRWDKLRTGISVLLAVFPMRCIFLFFFGTWVSHAMLLLLPFAFCYICISHFIIYFFLLSLSLSGFCLTCVFFLVLLGCLVRFYLRSYLLKLLSQCLKPNNKSKSTQSGSGKSEINTINK